MQASLDKENKTSDTYVKEKSSFGFKSIFTRTGEKEGLEKINTLAKIIISLLASLVTVVFSSSEGLLCLFLFSLIYALFLPEPKVLFYAYAVSIIMFAFACFFAYLLSKILPMSFNSATMAIPFLRLLVMLHVVLPLACSTRIQDILTALKSLRLPFCIYLPSAVMIRFIPTFLNDIKQVSETLKIRGYTMSVASTIRHPILMIRLLFTPLLFRSLKSSEDLGVAAELKGMNARTRITKYKTEKWQKRDSYLMLAVIVVFVIAIAVESMFGTEITGGHR